jgi:signal-transduction protein with cAMP-binding, CBS, and nucleotidyltransferase domain
MSMGRLQHHLGDFQDPLENYEPREYDDALKEALAEQTVVSIQCKPHAVVAPDETVGGALRKLAELRVASLLIAEEGKLVGVFTERDALERVSTRLAEVEQSPVREVMTTNPVVVYETDAAGAALHAIAVAGYRHVPVLDVHDQVVGVISPRRVFEFIDQHLQPC